MNSHKVMGRTIGMFFLLLGVGLLGSSVFVDFNSDSDTGHVFIRGVTGIVSSILGGYISIESLR